MKEDTPGCKGTQFTIVMEEAWSYKVPSIYIQVRILTKPRFTRWNKIKKFFGFNHTYEYEIEIV